MGFVFNFECEKCGYKFTSLLGEGMDSPLRIDSDAIYDYAGEQLDVIKKFFNEYPEGKINIGNTLAKCDNCAEYRTVNLMILTPKDDEDTAEIFQDDGGTTENFQVDDDIAETLKYPSVFSCKNCGSEIELVPMEESENLSCPKCDNKMNIIFAGLWD